jgi:hypothetical protein
MLHYPPVLTEVCKYCGAAVTLERQGDGRPWRGKLNYWYSTDHRCPECESALAARDSERRILEEALYGDRAS